MRSQDTAATPKPRTVRATHDGQLVHIVCSKRHRRICSPSVSGELMQDWSTDAADTWVPTRLLGIKLGHGTWSWNPGAGTRELGIGSWKASDASSFLTSEPWPRGRAIGSA